MKKLLGWLGVWCEWQRGHFYFGHRSVHLYKGPHLCEPHFVEGLKNWERACKPKVEDVAYKPPESFTY